MKYSVSVFLVIILSHLLHGQAICSKQMSKVYFGPKNVMVKQSNPSVFYVMEITDARESLQQLLVQKDSTELDNVQILNDINRLDVLIQDWNRWSEASPYHNISDTLIEVKEYLYVKEIEDKTAMSIRGVHPENCLHSNPDDCIMYERIRRWKIRIEDDFGNTFKSDYHKSFNNVGMEEYDGSYIFYRKRTVSNFSV